MILHLPVSKKGSGHAGLPAWNGLTARDEVGGLLCWDLDFSELVGISCSDCLLIFFYIFYLPLYLFSMKTVFNITLVRIRFIVHLSSVLLSRRCRPLLIADLGGRAPGPGGMTFRGSRRSGRDAPCGRGCTRLRQVLASRREGEFYLAGGVWRGRACLDISSEWSEKMTRDCRVVGSCWHSHGFASVYQGVQ